MWGPENTSGSSSPAWMHWMNFDNRHKPSTPQKTVLRAFESLELPGTLSDYHWTLEAVSGCGLRGQWSNNWPLARSCGTRCVKQPIPRWPLVFAFVVAGFCRSYAEKTANGPNTRKRILNKASERLLSGLFGGDWLRAEYFSESPTRKKPL